jgi:drug/metabolite transporter (DMT)-like permease
VFALLASLSFSLYFIASHRLVHTTDPITNAAWVSLGAGVSLLTRGLVTGDLHWPSGQGGMLLVYGVANAFAFGFMFAALRKLGPTRTAVILTFEVFATVVLAALFLDETLRPLQAIGGIAIAAGAVLVTLATPVTLEHELETPP